MKRLLLFTPIILIVFIYSCKKDPKPEELLIGKWNATKVISDSENLVGNANDYKTEIEIEFTQGGNMILAVTETDSSVTPAEVLNYSIPCTYSWSGDNLTINYFDNLGSLSVSGPAVISKSTLLFTASSGNSEELFSLIEADKK